MLRNYFKIAFRNIIKQRAYSLINISGLAIGLASFILIMLYIFDELSYDKHHTDADRIYRVISVHDFNGVGEKSASQPFPLAFTMKQEYPGMIENVVRIFNFQAPRRLMEYGEHKFNERRVFFADSTYFDVFDHRFIAGNPETALEETFSMVITESTAKKYFGNDDPMGKTMRFEERFDLKVTGVIEDVPSQSHFKFDMLGSLSSVRKMYRGSLPKTWVWNPCWTYILMEENADPENLTAQFAAFVDKYFYDAMKENISLGIQKVTDIHLNSRLDYELEPNNNMSYIYILGAIALFLLIIAMINFMNLATATSSTRSREIGVKKVVGAHRNQLIIQFIGESVILSFIALIFALIFVELTLPSFNNFTNKSIEFSRLLSFESIVFLIGVGLFTGIISGVYPAFYLSAFNPVKVIKGALGRGGTRSAMARKVLVVVQFSIAIFLIAGTLLVYNQLHHLRNANPGFDKENIVVIPINSTPVVSKYEAFKSELQENPSVVSVTAMDDVFGVSHNTHEFRPEGYPEDKWLFYPALVVQYDFVETFKIKMLAGRDYHEDNKTDPVEGILISESMVKHQGWKSNEDALGKKFRSLQGNEKVIGVFENLHATSLHEPAGPFVLNMKEKPRVINWFMKYLAVRIAPGNYNETISFIESKWKDFSQGRPFEYSFLDQELDKSYKDEENLGKLSLIFTLLIIFISGLGLLGLASFMTEQRTKEIGIRKTLGASSGQIVSLLSVEFFRLILVANLIAWPLAYLVMTDWLQHFANRISFNWTLLIIAGVIAMIVALSITSLKAWHATRLNTADTLKYE